MPPPYPPADMLQDLVLLTINMLLCRHDWQESAAEQESPDRMMVCRPASKAIDDMTQVALL